jgi:hypothetical protein
MKLSLLALIAPAVTFALLFAAVTAHAETPAEHAAKLMAAPLVACTVRPLTQGTVGSTVQVCVVVAQPKAVR